MVPTPLIRQLKSWHQNCDPPLVNENSSAEDSTFSAHYENK